MRMDDNVTFEEAGDGSACTELSVETGDSNYNHFLIKLKKNDFKLVLSSTGNDFQSADGSLVIFSDGRHSMYADTFNSAHLLTSALVLHLSAVSPLRPTQCLDDNGNYVDSDSDTKNDRYIFVHSCCEVNNCVTCNTVSGGISSNTFMVSCTSCSDGQATTEDQTACQACINRMDNCIQCSSASSCEVSEAGKVPNDAGTACKGDPDVEMDVTDTDDDVQSVPVVLTCTTKSAEKAAQGNPWHPIWVLLRLATTAISQSLSMF